MQDSEPTCKIPYVTLISEFLSDFRELHSRLDITDRFGRDCLTDITQSNIKGSSAILRDGADQKIFRFKESDERWGLLDVIVRARS